MQPLDRLPGGHPIFGHVGAFRTDRVGLLRRIGRESPEAVELPMGVFRRIVVVSDPVLANELLVTKQSSFVKAPGLAVFLRPVLGHGLLTSERPVHDRQRRLLAPAFAPKRVAAYAATMTERTDRLVDSLASGDTLDLTEALMKLTFEIAGKTLFDTEVGAAANTVSEAITTAMTIVMGQLSSVVPMPPVIPTPANLTYRRAVSRLDDIVFRMIDERRREGGDRGDVLSMLLASRDEDGTAMTDRQVRDEAMTLLLAGHETTANALAWTFLLLARHPEARERLEAELDALGRTPEYDDLKRLPYTLAVLKESMRLYPPAYLLGRRAIEDTVLAGRRIKKWTVVLVNILGLHQRPEIWPEPERFQPERFLGDRERQLPKCAYLPFGAGPRVCIGNHFALMEGQLLLATMARRARFSLERDEPVACEPLVTLRPKGALSMRVNLR
jgi:cytochrome P450